MNLSKNFLQLFLYLIVGGLATLVEWAAFYVLNSIFSVHYMIATALAFVLSTFVNWAFGRLILFREKTDQSTFFELVKIYAVSIIGLLLNLLIMFIAVEKIGLNEMISKIIATCLVFIWNFLIRKLVIYKI